MREMRSNIPKLLRRRSLVVCYLIEKEMMLGSDGRAGEQIVGRMLVLPGSLETVGNSRSAQSNTNIASQPSA